MKKEIYLLAIIVLLMQPAFAQYKKTAQSALISNSTEICDNEIDDDGDGLIDINDPDCQCNQAVIPSLIPNHSFETYTQCPTAAKQLSYCPGWSDANTGSVDYMNTCGYVFQSITAAGLVPFPDGQGIAGGYFMPGWKEYPGSCLQQSLAAGTPYQLTLSIASLPTLGGGYNCANCTMDYEPVNITLYGTNDCSNLPTTTVETVPGLSPNLANAQWFKIGTALYNPAKKWGQLTITFTPSSNITAVAIGSPQDLPPTYATSSGQPYFIYDNLILNTAALFEVNIQSSGSFCSDDLILIANPAVPAGSSATYQWYKDGIAINAATASTYTIPANLLNSGEYRVRIMEGTGCVISSIYTVSAALPSAAVTITQPNCTSATGNIIITTPAAYYSFDNGATWVNNPDSGPLSEGFYRIKIKTTEGCVSTALVIRILRTYLVPEYTAVQPSCGAGGTITITTPAAFYSFDDGVTWTANHIASNLAIGTHKIKTKDVSGCIYYATDVFLYDALPQYPNYQITQPTCTAGGIITITTVAAEYSFDDGASWVNNPIADSLSPGYYILKTRNATACVSNGIGVTIDAPPAIGQPTYTLTQPGCSTGGSITITTIADQYSFDGGISWDTDATATGLAAGNYNLAVKNSNGCISSFSFVHLNESHIPAPSYQSVAPDCDNDGSITITTPAAAYSFDGGASWSNNATATDLATGYYEIKIKNSNGCTSYPSYVFIVATATLPAAPSVNITQPVNCSLTTGSIIITTAAAQYSFDNGNTWVGMNVSGPLASGSYRVKIKDASGCQSPDTIVTINQASVTPAPIVVDKTYCQGDGPLPLSATGTDLLWYTTATAVSGTATAPIPLTGSTGIFNWYVSQTLNGCESPRVAIAVTVDAIPAAPTAVTSLIYGQNEPTLPLQAQGIDLRWYDEQGNILFGTPTPDSNTIGSTVYYVSQAQGACESPMTQILVTIIADPLTDITFPAFFTPNGDSFNEYWNIKIPAGSGLSDGNTFIFDRYGKLLASIRSEAAGWDGTYNGSSMPASDYWFKSVYKDNGIEKEIKGHFSLKR